MAKTSNGEIIRAGKGAERIGDWLNQNMDQIRLALPRGSQAEKMARVFVTEIQRVPKLVECTPASLLSGFLQASACGLELGAHLGQAYLIPFRVKGTMTATLVFGYKGLAQLAYRSGVVDDLSASAVRRADFFSYRLGTSPEVLHEKGTRARDGARMPAATEKIDLDDVTHAYAIAWLRGASRPKIEVLTREEIDKVRASSRAASFSDSPWNSWYAEMAAKTALRRICKQLPQTPESRPLHVAVAVDEAADANVEAPYDLPASIEIPMWDPSTGEMSPEEEARLAAAERAEGAS